ncbi:zinc finger CCCH domain-containing protein 16-like [Aricia agestis]|uniref:zinc finger CCCH domain-containing protein 16-like n=1 Tax=Aricia agestis TaxID=91739 RepID=UPI001C20BE1D|nr:zinc finger CCCH domain-containing protein 16-like [Aricia agestis]
MVICKYFQQGCCKYGPNCRFEHVFGSKYSYSRAPQQQQHTNQNNVFNQATGNNASSLFRSAVQSNATPSVFGQNPASRPSVFNRLGHQPQQPAHQNPFVSSDPARSLFAQATQSVFAQANAQIPVQPPQNMFAPIPRSVFAQANHNVFQTQHLAPQQNSAANLFASAAQNVFAPSTPAPKNVFAQSNNTPITNVFEISKQTSFELCDDNLYSNLEDLSKTDIQAFESVEFRLGYIPELPPPKVLCV